MNFLKKQTSLRAKRENKTTLVLFMFLIVCSLAMYLLAPAKFGTVNNIRNMGLQMAETGVLSLAFFVAIVCGGFNMACVQIANLSAIVMGGISSGMFFANVLSSDGARLLVGLFACLVTGAACGCLIAFFVTKFKLVPLMVTSAIAQLFEGLSMILSKGQSITTHRDILKIGNYNVFGLIPALFLIAVVCFVFVNIYLNKLKIGEQAQLLGINRFASLYSGNDNTKITYITYTISGMLSSIGGLIVFAKYGAIKADYGSALGSTLLLVVLLGGVILTGGGGRVINVFISLAITQVLSTGIALTGTTVYFTKFFLGLLLLVVILVNTRKTGIFEKKVSLAFNFGLRKIQGRKRE